MTQEEKQAQKNAIRASEINQLAKDCYAYAEKNGFWEGRDNTGEKLALIHSEISEALEASRKTEPEPDHHCPEYPNFAIELADAVIRIADLCGRCSIPLGDVIVAKMNYNNTRPYKHGKAF